MQKKMAKNGQKIKKKITLKNMQKKHKNKNPENHVCKKGKKKF